MALVGLLSTQLLHHLYVRRAPERPASVRFSTVIDRLPQVLKTPA